MRQPDAGSASLQSPRPSIFFRSFCKSIKRTGRHRSSLYQLRSLKTCRGVAGDQCVQDEIFQYKTSSTDAAFIALCRKAYGNIAGWQSDRDWKDGDETYKGMVEVSRALMKVASFLVFLFTFQESNPSRRR